jgi:hypothetical protein
VPAQARRLVLFIGALSATLALGGAGAGFAGADPDPGTPPDAGTSSAAGGVSKPAPTTVETPVAPMSPLDRLRDALSTPRTIFGDGRTPGQPPKVVVKTPEVPKTDPEIPVKVPDPEIPVKVPDPEVPVKAPDPEIPVKKSVGSSVEFTLPGAARFSIPVLTLPWTPDTQFFINLSDPQSTFSSVQDTLATLNQLVSDAYAPYNPFPPPPPPPGPNMKIMQEEPVIDTSGRADGDGGLQSMSGGMADLPVLRAPMAFPPVRLVPARPPAETVPAGTASQVLGVGTAGVRAPAGRDPVTQGTQGSVRAGEPTLANTTSPMGNTAHRQGFPQYLRAARIGEVAAVALPGVAGLLAITVSGGVIGYRQANSGRQLRANAERFLQ